LSSAARWFDGARAPMSRAAAATPKRRRMLVSSNGDPLQTKWIMSGLAMNFALEQVGSIARKAMHRGAIAVWKVAVNVPPPARSCEQCA
jgi:hypothetical protein